MPECRICWAVGNHPRFLVREMMFGLRETFEYFQCLSCGCLQIGKPPCNLSKYYPDDYYSFAELRKNRALKRYFKRRLFCHILDSPSLLGALLERRYGVPPMLAWLKRAGICFEQPILDVGCGKGHFLQSLNAAGFSNLFGIDPFLDRDTDHGSGLRVLKGRLEELDGTYDFIILNHSLEHMEDQLAAVKNVHRLLRAGCVALLRLPVADGYAWRTYGVDWVQLDAPRHLFLHTEESLEVLAESANFKIEEIVYDSTAFQFWGSEQYRQNIPLRDERSYAVNPRRAPFFRRDIERYGRLAVELNAKGEGDQACFLLRK